MSVRKREWVTSKGEAKSAWIVDYSDTKGKRRLKTFAKKRDADAFAAQSAVEVRQGTHVADRETVTVAEAGRAWLKAGEVGGPDQRRLERSTIDQRRQHLDFHIVPFIGDVRLNKINVAFVRQFQVQLREAGRSVAMVKRVTVSLGSILNEAQENGQVQGNAVRDASRNRTKKLTQSERRHKSRLAYGVDIPTMQEIGAIVRAAEGRYRPLLITAIFTGLRSSELRGLRWEDVDLAKGVLHVRQRVDRYGETGMPKSDAGQRTIPLTPMVINTLREWKLSGPKGEAGLVFANGAGNVEPHNNALHRGLWPTLMRAGVVVDTGKVDEEGRPVMMPKYTGFHALRHWFASWCIARKADGGLELSPKVVQARMGHSSITVTFDTYGHMFPVADEQMALAAAERMLLAANAT